MSETHEVQEILTQIKELRESLKPQTFDGLPDYLSVKQIATYLNIGISLANKEVSKADFPKPMPFGGVKRLYDKHEVKAWIDKQRAKQIRRYKIS